MVMRRIQLTDIFERLGEHRAAYLLNRPRTTARAYDRPWKQALSRHNVVCQKLAFVMAAWRKALILRNLTIQLLQVTFSDSPRIWASEVEAGPSPTFGEISSFMGAPLWWHSQAGRPIIAAININ